LFLVMDF